MRWIFIAAFWLFVCVTVGAGMRMAGISEDARTVIMVGVGALAAGVGTVMFPKSN